MKVYLVKSFGVEGYVNLKVFQKQEDASFFASSIECQIPEGVTDEFVEIEEMDLL
jgi:hypothetical protein